MNKFVQQLGLRFNPFDSIAGTTHFYMGAGREKLLDEILQLSRYSQDIVVVTAQLGAGKSSIAEWYVKSLGKETVVVHIQASLFMNQTQILEGICSALGIRESSAQARGALTTCIRERVNELSNANKTLQLVIDDAHELGDDALGILLEFARDPALSATVHLLLLGESQLLNMLDKMLPFNREIVACSKLELSGLNSEEVLDYVTFKLKSAGLKGELPIAKNILGDIFNRSNGVPGTINALVRDQLENCDFSLPEKKLQIPSIYYATAAVLFVALMLMVLFTDGDDGQIAEEQVSGMRQIDIGLPAANIAIEQPIEFFAPAEDLPVSTPADGAIPLAVQPLVEQPVVEQPVEELPVAEEAPELVSVTAKPDAPTPSPSVQEGPAPEQQADFSEFERRLLAKAPQSYTLQVLGSQSEAKVREFISGQRDDADFAYFESRYQDHPWYVVVYGDYQDREVAAAAITRLPNELKGLQPWARQLSAIQADIRKYNQ